MEMLYLLFKKLPRCQRKLISFLNWYLIEKMPNNLILKITILSCKNVQFQFKNWLLIHTFKNSSRGIGSVQFFTHNTV